MQVWGHGVPWSLGSACDLPCHCWLPPLNSAAVKFTVGPGLDDALGDPWQPPPGRHTSAQLPLASGTLVSAKFSIPATPGPGVHLRIISPHHSCLFQVYWLASDICLYWSGPSPPHSELLPRVSMEQRHQGSPVPWNFPSLTLHACALLPGAREVKSELGSDRVTCCHSFPHSRITRNGKGWTFLLFLTLLCASPFL